MTSDLFSLYFSKGSYSAKTRIYTYKKNVREIKVYNFISLAFLLKKLGVGGSS